MKTVMEEEDYTLLKEHTHTHTHRVRTHIQRLTPASVLLHWHLSRLTHKHSPSQAFGSVLVTGKSPEAGTLAST